MRNKTLYSIIVLSFLLGLLFGLGLGMFASQKGMGNRISKMEETIYVLAVAQSYMSDNLISCFRLNNISNNLTTHLIWEEP